MLKKIRVQAFLPYLGLCVLSYLVGDSLYKALNSGMQKTLVLMVLAPFFLAFPYVQAKIGTERLAQYLLFLFWLPIPFVLTKYSIFRNLYLFETAIWGFFIYYLISKGSNVHNRLRQFPYMPFVVYVAGALLAFILYSLRRGEELRTIRLLCVFPLFLCMEIFLSIRSTKDAHRLLRIILISGACLSILFLFGSKSLSFIQESGYASGSGRLSMVLYVPFLGGLTLQPATSGTIFGFLSIVALFIWFFSDSFFWKNIGFITLLLFGAVIITAQGRGGAIGFFASAFVMTVLCLTTGSLSRRSVLIKSITAVGFLIGGMIYFSFQSGSMNMQDRIFLLASDPLSDTNLVGRLWRWEEGLMTILQNPFGVGLWGFHTSPGGGSWNVHNLWLFLGLSFGVVGLAGFVWVLISFLKVFLKGLKSQDIDVRRLSIMGIGIIVSIIVAGQFSPLIWEPVTVVVVWAPLACAIAAAKLRKNVLPVYAPKLKK